MSGFFTSSDKIKVGQTEVSIPSENGLNYNPQGRIELYIPPTSKFIDLSQSKLKMDVELSVPTVNDTNGVQRVQLDAETGLHSLIRSIRIFTGRKTALLEEIEGYDILTALRYDYETNESLKSKRALGEGATSYDPACRGTIGTTKTVQGNCFSNPYLTKVDGNPTLSTSYETTDDDYGLQKVKGELHLNTGLFRNEAVFPSLLTDGLFIEILLQDAKKVFRTLDSTNRYRRLRLNPVYHSINGEDASRATNGTTKTVQGNCFSNPYLTKVDGNPTLSTSYETTDDDYGLQKVKGELHLNTGLFRNEAVFPSLLTDGLFIEILLQDAKKVFRTLDSTNRYRRLRLNPVYHSINGEDASRATNGSFAHVGASANASSDTFYFTHDNNQTSVATFPFVVGEKVTFVSQDNASVNGSIARITQIEQVTGAPFGTSKTKITLSEKIQNTTGETWTGIVTGKQRLPFHQLRMGM